MLPWSTFIVASFILIHISVKTTSEEIAVTWQRADPAVMCSKQKHPSAEHFYSQLLSCTLSYAARTLLPPSPLPHSDVQQEVRHPPEGTVLLFLIPPFTNDSTSAAHSQPDKGEEAHGHSDTQRPTAGAQTCRYLRSEHTLQSPLKRFMAAAPNLAVSP